MHFLFLILFFSLGVNSCTQAQVRGDFYHGLNDSANAVEHFEAALASGNEFARQAAAQELAGLMAGGVELTPGTMRRVKQEARGFWAEAFKTVDTAVKSGEKPLSFLLNIEGAPEEARFYVLDECRKHELLFDETQRAAIDGHYAVSRLRYNEALVFFRALRNEDGWPREIPELFKKYPVLINDLGRAFQYTASALEGMNLFLQWEKNLPLTEEAWSSEIRFRLFFYAARIARRNGLNDEALTLFKRCLTFPPTEEQADACIWYILDLTLGKTPDIFIRHLEEVTPLIRNGRGVNDLLERFLQILAADQDWEKITRTIYLIKDTNAPIKAAYAWVAARAIQEGFVSGTRAESAVFLQAAYDAPLSDLSTALYYRMLSASALEKPFLPEFSQEPIPMQNTPSPALQFILGFFEHNALEHAMRYIRQMEGELSIEELRATANALGFVAETSNAKAGLHAQVIRLVTRYMGMGNYTPHRRDLELLFPRPFKKITEKYAQEANIAPEILFGLIRTESAFQSAIVSHAGAAGLTQLMADTARDMAGRIKRVGGPDYMAGEDGIDLTDPETNIHIGSFYLNHLNGRFEDSLLALLAYNGGQTRVRRWRRASSLPSDLFLETVSFRETRDYGRKVMGAAAVYKELYYNTGE